MLKNVPPDLNFSSRVTTVSPGKYQATTILGKQKIEGEIMDSERQATFSLRQTVQQMALNNKLHLG